MKKNQPTTKKINLQTIINILFAIIICLLFCKIWHSEQQIHTTLESLSKEANHSRHLEIDLRNRGIINGELSIDKRKPYSLEQMIEFEESNKKANSSSSN